MNHFRDFSECYGPVRFAKAFAKCIQQLIEKHLNVIPRGMKWSANPKLVLCENLKNEVFLHILFPDDSGYVVTVKYIKNRNK